jgi:hypothetical protein
MKKTFIFLSAMLCLCECLCAMELMLPLVKEKKKNNKESHNVQLIPLIVELPEEIQGNIVAKMHGFKGKKNYIIPILLACKFSDEIGTLGIHCPLSFGNKRLTAFDLWRLPEEARLTLMQEPEAKWYCVDTRIKGVFTEDEKERIIDTLPKNLQNGLSITVLKNKSWCQRFGWYTGSSVVFCMGVAFGITCLFYPEDVYKGLSLGFVVGGPVSCLLSRILVWKEKGVTERVDYENQISENSEKNSVMIEILEDSEEDSIEIEDEDGIMIQMLENEED